MTDRVRTLTVLLDKEYRDDDVREITNASGMIKGVVKVENIISTTEWMAIETARRELGEKLWAVLYPKTKE